MLELPVETVYSLWISTSEATPILIALIYLTLIATAVGGVVEVVKNIL